MLKDNIRKHSNPECGHLCKTTVLTLKTECHFLKMWLDYSRLKRLDIYN